MQVNYRYSNTDFVAYLISIGYKPESIEVIRDRYNQIRAFVHFLGDKETFITLQRRFEKGDIEGNIVNFCLSRQRITKQIKAEILNFQASGLEKKIIKKEEDAQ